MAHRNERETILNRILLALPHQVREEILRQCDHVELASGHVIYSAGAPVAHVYFINSGIISLIKSMRDGRSVEIGAVGIEGLVGLFAAYGFDHALVDYVVQVPGTALRISKKTLQNEILIHDTLRSVVMRYLFLLTDQLAQVSACNRLHSLEQRCCHWLLVAHDSVMADKFQLTHEFLALLLGVQRPSVSMTANGLQRRGLIRYSHGHITILNRAAVEEAACECYRTLRGQIDHAFKHPPIEPPRWATLRKV
jgi:CRP-like cAMP-binding protein